MTRSLKSFVAALALLLACPLPASAQQFTGEPVTTLSGGYAFLRDFSWSEDLPIGWIAALTHRLNDRLSIVGEAGGSHGEYGTTGFTIQRYAFLGGVRLSGGESSVRPFIQLLSGYSRQGGDVGIANGIAVQPGGGAELLLDNGLILRFQGDFRTTREDGVWWRQFRLAGSVVWVLKRQR